jgi:hypothetical protein
MTALGPDTEMVTIPRDELDALKAQARRLHETLDNEIRQGTDLGVSRAWQSRCTHLRNCRRTRRRYGPSWLGLKFPAGTWREI